MTTGEASAPHRGTRAHAWAAAGTYLVLTVCATWPLARGLAKDVAWDLGDSLLNMWILSWDCEQIRAILGGNLARVAHVFDANIFYPAPLTLAYSEHLFPQALQIFPVYLATRNPILCYNLLFISTYVLSGVGAYLLVRELTGDWRAGFVGGLLFAFAPYRIPQSSHLQVLSSQWMPLTLYGFTRYLNTRRRRALAGGAGALVLQNLSCGYFLLFFAPFAGAYLLWEVWRRQLGRDRRLWIEIATAWIGVVALTAPFLIPYVRARRMLSMARGIDEIAQFSADVYSYFTAFPAQHLWGPILQTFPRAEAELFPGAVTAILGISAFCLWIARAWQMGRTTPSPRPVLDAILMTLATLCAAAGAAALFERRIVFDIGAWTVRIVDIGRVVMLCGVILAAAAAASPRMRARFRALLTIDGFFCLAIVATWWLSLGPSPTSMGRPLDLPAPYRVLFDFVPGFDGFRVPARYAMTMALMLAVAAALTASALLRRRWGMPLVAALAVAFVIESHASPFAVNGSPSDKEHALPEPRVYRPDKAPPLYRRLGELPAGTVLLELPVGDPIWDLRAVYYSTAHWHPIVNGYSGYFPAGYNVIIAVLTDPDRTGDAAWTILREIGVTHVMVHENVYRPPEVEQIERWLQRHGATETARDGHDSLFTLAR